MSILASQQAQAWGSIIMWVVIMVVFVYFFMIRPQKRSSGMPCPYTAVSESQHRERTRPYLE